jgi:hypothetical protein
MPMEKTLIGSDPPLARDANNQRFGDMDLFLVSSTLSLAFYSLRDGDAPPASWLSHADLKNSGDVIKNQLIVYLIPLNIELKI